MTPTQADREAAEAIYAGMTRQFEAKGNAVTRTHAVTPDDDGLVQAFARHRLAAEAAAFEKAAGVAEGFLPGGEHYETGHDEFSMAIAITKIIRKLAGEKHD